jgi:hypothetical protein
VSEALTCAECGAKLRSKVYDDGEETEPELSCPNGCEHPTGPVPTGS